VAKESIVWQSWSEALFPQAQKVQKPILLFVGYRGCAWCERMEEESFGDERIVSLITTHTVAVRVDSRERPDIGQYAHRIFTQMTGREANYPLLLFLSEEGVPLYSASYLPERSREGMMGLDETIILVARKYSEEKEMLLQKGREIMALLEERSSTVEATRLHQGIKGVLKEQLGRLYDTHHGGFGEKPKFPRHSLLHLLMDLCEQSTETAEAEMLKQTLDAMCTGALRERGEGGFVRYCSDPAWQQPQPGKTLYDNALMVQVLLRAHTLLDVVSYRDIALESVAFIHRDMDGKYGMCAFYDRGGCMDRRVILSWNAMAVKALLMAGEHERRYRQMAVELLAKLQEYGMRKGRLFHSYMPGEEPQGEAYLEDYAWMAEALIYANRVTGEAHYLSKASELINEALRRFFNRGRWRYSDTPLPQPADPRDRAYASAAAVMASVLYQAAEVIDPAYRKFAERTLEVYSYDLMRQPVSMPELTRVAIQHY